MREITCIFGIFLFTIYCNCSCGSTVSVPSINNTSHLWNFSICCYTHNCMYCIHFMRTANFLYLCNIQRGGDGSTPLPRRPLTSGKIRYPLYRRLGGPQGRSGQVRKISPQLVFDRRTFKPVASRYTDWATGPTFTFMACRNNIMFLNNQHFNCSNYCCAVCHNLFYSYSQPVATFCVTATVSVKLHFVLQLQSVCSYILC